MKAAFYSESQRRNAEKALLLLQKVDEPGGLDAESFADAARLLTGCVLDEVQTETGVRSFLALVSLLLPEEAYQKAAYQKALALINSRAS